MALLRLVLKRLAAKLLIFLILVLGPGLGLRQAQAQDAPATDTGQTERAMTGGAQTLDDILARQRGQAIDDTFRRTAVGDRDTAAGLADQLGTLGGASDPELWRALRYGSADITASNSAPGATLMVQDGGMAWLTFRQGPLRTWGGYAMLAMVGILVLFYLIRGRIRIDGEKAGVTIERFKPVERFGHWLLAGSFILLGLTGLISLFGRVALIPLFGKDTFSTLAIASKWIHNNVSWAFMLGLILIFVMWVAHNLPNRHDLVWLAKGGGLFSKHTHPPAKKFNAGQKMIFWIVIILGASASISGLSLLFPFELPLFAKTFSIINSLGLPALFGAEALPTALAPHGEMQLAQIWHAAIGIAMFVVIIAHIYLGSVGMEGAYDAMGSGEVDLQWAKEHHSLWVEALEENEKPDPATIQTPAE